MADEAVIHAEGSGEKVVCRQFTVAAGTAIAKGTLMMISGDRTAIAHDGVLGVSLPAGFAMDEKTATDGRVTMACQRTGVVEAVADGAITTGQLVEMGTAANKVKVVTIVSMSSLASGNILARALENAATAERVKIALLLG